MRRIPGATRRSNVFDMPFSMAFFSGEKRPWHGIGATPAILSRGLHRLRASAAGFAAICDWVHPPLQRRTTEPDNPFEAFQRITCNPPHRPL
jgi:hypothetical protein